MFIVHRDEEKEGDVDLKLLMIRTLIREDCCGGKDLDLDQTMHCNDGDYEAEDNDENHLSLKWDKDKRQIRR